MAGEVKHWWWLSFSEEAGFLGGTVVEADHFYRAIKAAWEHEVNPGGECVGIDLGDSTVDGLLPMVPYRLYSKAWMDEFQGGSVRIKT